MRDVTAITFYRQAVLSPELFTFANLSNRWPVASVAGARNGKYSGPSIPAVLLASPLHAAARGAHPRSERAARTGRRLLIDDYFGPSLSADEHGYLARSQQLSATLLRA
jgi:hypothetical protein